MSNIYLYQDKFVFLDSIHRNVAKFFYLDGSDDYELYTLCINQGEIQVDRYFNRSYQLDFRDEPYHVEEFKLTVPEHTPFDIRIEAAALALTQAIKQTRLEMNYESVDWSLTAPQVAFMLKYHDYITRAYAVDGLIKTRFRREPIAWIKPGYWLHIIRWLESLQEYRGAFGGMSWDEAYDRYEEAPEYDSFLDDLFRVAYNESKGISYEKQPEKFPQNYSRVRNFQTEHPDLFQALFVGDIRLNQIIEMGLLPPRNRPYPEP